MSRTPAYVPFQFSLRRDGRPKTSQTVYGQAGRQACDKPDQTHAALSRREAPPARMSADDPLRRRIQASEPPPPVLTSVGDDAANG